MRATASSSAWVEAASQSGRSARWRLEFGPVRRGRSARGGAAGLSEPVTGTAGAGRPGASRWRAVASSCAAIRSKRAERDGRKARGPRRGGGRPAAFIRALIKRQRDAAARRCPRRGRARGPARPRPTGPGANGRGSGGGGRGVQRQELVDRAGRQVARRRPRAEVRAEEVTRKVRSGRAVGHLGDQAAQRQHLAQAHGMQPDQRALRAGRRSVRPAFRASGRGPPCPRAAGGRRGSVRRRGRGVARGGPGADPGAARVSGPDLSAKVAERLLQAARPRRLRSLQDRDEAVGRAAFAEGRVAGVGAAPFLAQETPRSRRGPAPRGR